MSNGKEEMIMSKKILLVDDELDMLKITKLRLEKSGYKIVIATNGEEALGWLQTSIPDLILLDLILPKIQGEEVCLQIKSNNRLKHIPIIVFTAKGEQIAKEAQRFCADDHILKPFKPEELLFKIKKLIG